MAESLTRKEFDEIAEGYKRQGAKFGVLWVRGRRDPILVFGEDVTPQQKFELRSQAKRVALPEKQPGRRTPLHAAG